MSDNRFLTKSMPNARNRDGDIVHVNRPFADHPASATWPTISSDLPIRLGRGQCRRRQTCRCECGCGAPPLASFRSRAGVRPNSLMHTTRRLVEQSFSHFARWMRAANRDLAPGCKMRCRVRGSAPDEWPSFPVNVAVMIPAGMIRENEPCARVGLQQIARRAASELPIGRLPYRSASSCGMRKISGTGGSFTMRHAAIIFVVIGQRTIETCPRLAQRMIEFVQPRPAAAKCVLGAFSGAQGSASPCRSPAPAGRIRRRENHSNRATGLVAGHVH